MIYKKRTITFLLLFSIIFSFICPVYAEPTTDEETIKMEDTFKNGKINDTTSPAITIIESVDGNSLNTCLVFPQEIVNLISDFDSTFNYRYQVEDGIKAGFQLDYKIDKGEWHYSKSWDTLDYSNMKNDDFRNTVEMQMDEMLDTVCDFSPISTYIASDINGDFSSIIKKNDEGAFIDFSNHSVFIRVRSYATFTPNGEETKYIFSEWSKEVSPKPLSEQTAETIPSPKFNGLLIYPQSGITNFEIKVENIKELSQILAIYRSTLGQQAIFDIKGYLIPKNGQGTFDISDAAELQSNNIKTGLSQKYVFTYDKEEITEIDDWSFVARVVFSENDLTSEYTDVVPISAICLNDPRKDEDGILIEGEVEIIDRCPLCGFCPQPLGLCIFSYLLFFIAIVIIIIIGIVMAKKRQERNNY